MKKGRSGVDYIPVETRVSVYFDQDHICCQFCPFFETYSRKQCRLTGEYCQRVCPRLLVPIGIGGVI